MTTEVTTKVKRVRTVSETFEMDNSADAGAKLDIRATVSVSGGKVNSIQGGTINERESDNRTGQSLGVFACANSDIMDIHLYRKAPDMSRAEIMAEVEAFINQLDEEFANNEE